MRNSINADTNVLLVEPIKSAFEQLEKNYSGYKNVKFINKAIDIKSSLIRQLENPVQWAKSILEMKNKGINHFIEVGPGKVLQGLNKRIDRSIISQGVDSITKLEKIDV